MNLADSYSKSKIPSVSKFSDSTEIGQWHLSKLRKIVLNLPPFPGRAKNKRVTDSTDYWTYSVICYGPWSAYSSSLEIMLSHRKSVEGCRATSFSFSRWKIGCMERRNVEYLWHSSTYFLQIFITGLLDSHLTKITGMILKFHNSAYIIWSTLNRFEPQR